MVSLVSPDVINVISPIAQVRLNQTLLDRFIDNQ
jgi:hypothetical protein